MKKRTTKTPTDPRLDDLRAASRTIGDTAEDRLRWVTTFARAPLLQHSADFAKAGDCLVALAWPVPPMVVVPPPLSRETVTTLHDELRTILSDLVTRDAGSTVFPVKAPVQLARLTAMHKKPAMWATSRTIRTDDPRTDILLAVQHYVVAGGGRLLACLECRAPFVGRKRQEYCSEVCSQRARTRRHAPKRRKGGS
jgi:hypothetical protein